jgi:hypothetical protein
MKSTTIDQVFNAEEELQQIIRQSGGTGWGRHYDPDIEDILSRPATSSL